MASRIVDAGGARIVGSHVPLNAVLAAVPSLTAIQCAALAERLIDRLDDLDADPDLEPNGDEQEGDDDEDGDQDRCLAGDDAVFAGPAVYGALGFPGRPSPWGLGMNEDCEPDEDCEESEP